MATHSIILAWEIPWTEEPSGLCNPWGCKRVRHNLVTKQRKCVYVCVYMYMCVYMYICVHTCIYTHTCVCTCICVCSCICVCVLVAQMVKHLPAMWETQVQSLGQEDPLEKEMATRSSALAWKIPWMEEPGGATVHGVAKIPTRLSDFTSLHVCVNCQKYYSYK